VLEIRGCGSGKEIWVRDQGLSVGGLGLGSSGLWF
jgi:hypothetical protein